MFRRANLWFCASLLSFLLVFRADATDRLLVFAPASLTGTIEKIAESYADETARAVSVSVASTAQLARQIEAGAPADVFISADLRWINWLRERKLLDGPSQAKKIARNNLVVAVRNETENWINVEKMLTGSRFAMAEPEAVPAGRYAKQALISRGWWDAAKGNAVFGENVRVTLRRLALGEVEAAIVYASDLKAEPSVRAALTFAGSEHSPMITYAALTVNASAGADKFLAFLGGEKALKTLKNAGFLAPPTQVQ